LAATRGCHGLVTTLCDQRQSGRAGAAAPRASAAKCLAPKAGTRALQSHISGKCSIVVVPMYLIAACDAHRRGSGGLCWAYGILAIRRAVADAKQAGRLTWTFAMRAG